MGRTVKLSLYNERKERKRDLLWQNRVYGKNDMRDFFRLCRLLNYLLQGNKSKSEVYGTRLYTRAAQSARQKCVVKCRYSYKPDQHKKFLKEYLPQENKKNVEEKPELFGDRALGENIIDHYKNAMVGKHYKFIISPEKQGVDTEALTRTLVKRMEAAVGFNFHWIAAVHNDTDHKHAHLLINGVDKNGKEVDFDKTFLKQTIIEMSRQLCTEMIGQRSPEEIAASLSGVYKANRYCYLDEQIEQSGKRTVNGTGEEQIEVTVQTDLMRKRLLHLTELGFAKQKDGFKYRWILEKDWARKLKAASRYNSFLKALNELKNTSAGNLMLYTKECGGINGVITRRYIMNDEDSWNNAILIENKEEGKAWYVPLYYEPDKRLQDAVVRLTPDQNQKGLLTPKLQVIQWSGHPKEIV